MSLTGACPQLLHRAHVIANHCVERPSTTEERFALLAEWYDPTAALLRRFQLLFYPRDGSVEMFDVKNQRTFLRRTKYEELNQEDLFVGNRVNIFSRQLSLIGYGDQYTASKLGSKKERKQAADFYSEHQSKSFFNNLMQFVTSGPVIAMEVMGDEAVSIWRKILGPTDSESARKDAPNSLRAQFGTDGTKNAAHGSKGGESSLISSPGFEGLRSSKQRENIMLCHFLALVVFEL
ncbi:hypothetical protein JZ751_028062 [Albula glossodonta]|uniref:DM10 domain-containing protein n=1 Tax=Albula glossodonta TaxID=121402 RepID=A0A8T2PAJ5_9TELE|nr:hypothetical protein JZ751_028062 [Albula glossodonta]